MRNRLDLLVFNLIWGIFDSIVSNYPVTQKLSLVEQKGLTSGCWALTLVLCGKWPSRATRPLQDPWASCWNSTPAVCSLLSRLSSSWGWTEVYGSNVPRVWQHIYFTLRYSAHIHIIRTEVYVLRKNKSNALFDLEQNNYLKKEWLSSKRGRNIWPWCFHLWDGFDFHRIGIVWGHSVYLLKKW